MTFRQGWRRSSQWWCRGRRWWGSSRWSCGSLFCFRGSWWTPSWFLWVRGLSRFWWGIPIRAVFGRPNEVFPRWLIRSLQVLWIFSLLCYKRRWVFQWSINRFITVWVRCCSRFIVCFIFLQARLTAIPFAFSFTRFSLFASLPSFGLSLLCIALTFSSTPRTQGEMSLEWGLGRIFGREILSGFSWFLFFLAGCGEWVSSRRGMLSFHRSSFLFL